MCNWDIIYIHLRNHSCSLSLPSPEVEKHEAHHEWKRFASFLVDTEEAVCHRLFLYRSVISCSSSKLKPT